MSQKHIYVNTSDLSVKRDFLELNNFIPVFHYPRSEFENVNPIEFGKLTFGRVDIHILLGRIRRTTDEPPKCHWCGERCQFLIETRKSVNFTFTETSTVCNSCGASGPKRHHDKLIDDMEKEWLKAWSYQDYNMIKPWDAELNEH
jgi:hypothetical protein